jgi:hypothetical protein
MVGVDVTIVASWTRAMKWTYAGVREYQPVMAVWAEAGDVLGADNGVAAMLRMACAALPEGAWRRRGKNVEDI